MPLWIKANKRCVGLHEIWLHIESRFARARTSAHKHVQISSVRPSVKTDSYILCKQLAFPGSLRGIPFVKLSRIAPLCRTHLLAAPIVPSGAEINSDSHKICGNRNHDPLQTFAAKLYGKRTGKCLGDKLHGRYQAVLHAGSHKECQPYDRHKSASSIDYPFLIFHGVHLQFCFCAWEHCRHLL